MFSVDLKVKGLLFSSRFPWKVGIVSFMAYPEMMAGKGDVVGNIKTLAEDPFFDGVEVCRLTEEQWREIKKFMDGKIVARGMQPDILTRKINLNSSESNIRSEAVNLVKREVERAASMGINRLAVCSGPDPGSERRGEEKELLIDSLSDICGYASKRGIEIFLEAFDRDWDKKLLIGPLSEAADVVRKVRKEHDNISLMWDLSHAPMLDEKPWMLEEVKDVLGHIHIGCAKKVGDRYIDSHPVFYTAGAVNGIGEVAELLRTLLKIDYKGMVSFEVKPEDDQTAEGIIATAKGVLISAYTIVAGEML